MPRLWVDRAGLLQGKPGIARFAALAAAVAGLSLVPVAQAGASANHRTLTVTKSPSPATGEGAGTVSSKPMGIKCGANCAESVARPYKDSTVVLTAKPAKEDSFVEWVGDCSGASPTCTVEMGADREVAAVFSGPSKAIDPVEALTVSRGESTGDGKVTAYGSLACEANCTETTVLYQGPVTLPKPKLGKTVVLKQAPAFGSEFTGWGGCDEVNEEDYCVVTMETDRTVTAEYTTLPNVDLTVEKSAYENGAGSVMSKPKGIGCGAYCTQAVAAMPEGSSIELKAKPAKENVFVEWENATEGSDCDEGKSPICVVTMDEAETIAAVFSGPSKVLNPAATLTLAKAGSGFGAVKATSGLKCEFLCASTGVLYQGPVTLPKPKLGKTVTLKATSAPGSAQVEWSGCESNPAPTECLVTMAADKEVTATFDELE